MITVTVLIWIHIIARENYGCSGKIEQSALGAAFRQFRGKSGFVQEMLIEANVQSEAQ